MNKKPEETATEAAEKGMVASVILACCGLFLLCWRFGTKAAIWLHHWLEQNNVLPSG